MPEKNDIFCDCGIVFLRGVSESDLNGDWYKWFNDSEVTRFQNKGTFPNTLEKQRAYFRTICESKNDVLFAIVEKSQNKHIGNIGLHRIDYIHRHAEVGLTIGSKEHWGKGIASICIGAVSKHAFDVMNLSRLFAVIMEGNCPSIKAFKKAGFKEEGVFSKHFFKNGNYLNAFILGLNSPSR